MSTTPQPGPLSRRDVLAAGLASAATRSASVEPATRPSDQADADRPPPACGPLISGVLPGTAVSASLSGPRSESGIGALMPWGGRLWLVTYTAHKADTGGGTGLYWVDADLRLHRHEASVVGTYANRFVHAPSTQMFIGPHVIDVEQRVRTIEPLVGVRLTATVAHLRDPANKIHVLGMESELFEVDVHSLAVRQLFTLNDDLALPAGFKPHYKGAYTTRDRLIVGSNTYHEPDAVAGTSTGGRLAEWDGRGAWRIIEQTAFCDINGSPMGDHANALALGWDRSSVILRVLARGQWSRYRLPKAGQSYDQAWYTEWPRIREVETERFLADMHGLFYEFPRMAYGGHYFGVRPVCEHLRIVPDFCSWKGLLVMAGDQHTAVGENVLAAEPQSNLWFGKTDDLWSFGKPRGWGGPWYETPVEAGQPSDPFLMTGFEHKCLHLSHTGGDPLPVRVQVDFMGNGSWHDYTRLVVSPGGYLTHIFPDGFSAHWVRLAPEAPSKATATFMYT